MSLDVRAAALGPQSPRPAQRCTHAASPRAPGGVRDQGRDCSVLRGSSIPAAGDHTAKGLGRTQTEPPGRAQREWFGFAVRIRLTAARSWVPLRTAAGPELRAASWGVTGWSRGCSGRGGYRRTVARSLGGVTRRAGAHRGQR